MLLGSGKNFVTAAQEAAEKAARESGQSVSSQEPLSKTKSNSIILIVAVVFGLLTGFLMMKFGG